MSAEMKDRIWNWLIMALLGYILGCAIGACI